VGHQRIRRKRRRRLQKPDTVIVVLASLAVLLLFVWSGLYWKESSERTVAATLNEGISLTGEASMPKEQVDDKPDVTGDDPQLPEANGPTQEAVNKPETKTTTEPNSPSINQTESPSTVKPNSPNTSQTESPSTEEPNSPSASQTEPPSTSEPTSPSAAIPDSPIKEAQKFEQEIVQVQAICTKGMEAIQTGADTSVQQLDKTDPAAIQAWKEKWTNELSAAEAECDRKFLEVSQNAEQNNVSEKVIKEWQQTFNHLKKEIYGESEMKKLEHFIGG
jgi:hypothetical protein